jgi:hypothetical protein
MIKYVEIFLDRVGWRERSEGGRFLLVAKDSFYNFKCEKRSLITEFFIA